MGRDYYSEDDTDQYELVEDQDETEDLDIPDVYWKKDIENIPDHDVQLEEIQKAKKLSALRKTLGERVDNGEISVGMYDSIIRPKMRKAATRCGRASVGITSDHLGDLSENAELYAKGNLKMLELKDQLKDKIADIGPDAAKELADRMHEEERLSDDTHERIKRQIRLNRGNSMRPHI